MAPVTINTLIAIIFKKICPLYIGDWWVSRITGGVCCYVTTRAYAERSCRRVLPSSWELTDRAIRTRGLARAIASRHPSDVQDGRKIGASERASYRSAALYLTRQRFVTFHLTFTPFSATRPVTRKKRDHDRNPTPSELRNLEEIHLPPPPVIYTFSLASTIQFVNNRINVID